MSLVDTLMKTFLLYVVTAVAEIAGCYFPYRWLKEGASPWLLVPGALSLALFGGFWTLHDTAAGRIYAAYGVYVGVAIVWLWAVGSHPFDGVGSDRRGDRAHRHERDRVSAARLSYQRASHFQRQHCKGRASQCSPM